MCHQVYNIAETKTELGNKAEQFLQQNEQFMTTFYVLSFFTSLYWDLM